MTDNDAKKEVVIQDGKPHLQYVPKYNFPGSDSAILDSPDSSALSINSPASSNFKDESYLSTPTGKSKFKDESSSNNNIHNNRFGLQSPLRMEYSKRLSFNDARPAGTALINDMLPPPNNRSSLVGNTGSYKSGRRQRPRSLYADLDSYINNTAPSLVMKGSSESLLKDKAESQSINAPTPTLSSLANNINNDGSPDTFFNLVPPPSASKAAAVAAAAGNTTGSGTTNYSSLYSLGSNGSQKSTNNLSPVHGTSRSGSRSEYDRSNITEFMQNSRSGSPIRTGSPSRRKDSNTSNHNPFNYHSVSLSNPNILQKPAHRKGHRYKHSSVSMNFFQEPKKRAQLNIPTSLPIPSINEFFESCSHSQRLKLGWCFIHLFYSSIVFLAGFQYSLACLTTLSHLVFFDSINNFLMVIVEIFKNFEVWEKSSIRFPFGLSRLEILFGFALSVSLFYVGFDLITHSLEEFVISLIDQDFNHDNHHNHHNNDEHKQLSDKLFLVLIFLGIIITLVSSKILHSNDNAFNNLDDKNGSLRYRRSNLDLLNTGDDDDDEGKGSKVSKKKSIISEVKINTYDKMLDGFKTLMQYNSIIKNPIKLLTVIFLSYLIFYPYVSKISSEFKINEIQTFLMSSLILYFAFHMMKRLSLIILLSFPYGSKIFKRSTNEINEEILRLDSFKSHYKMKKILISKVNYSLFVILVKVKMTGESDDEEFKLRNDIATVVKRALLHNKLENEYVKFDITMDIDRM